MTSDFIAAVARPGDTVIIGYNEPLTPEVADEMAAHWDALMEGTGVKVHFTDDVNSMVVMRPLTSEIVDEEF